MNEIMLGFDLDASCFALTMEEREYKLKLLTSDRGLHALVYQVNCVDFTRLSKSYEYRLIKYAQRGFAIYVPKFRRSFLYNKTLLSLKRVPITNIYDTKDLFGLKILLNIEKNSVRGIKINTLVSHIFDYDEGINVNAVDEIRYAEFKVGNEYIKNYTKYYINNYMYIDNKCVTIDVYLESHKLKTVSNVDINALINLHGPIRMLVEFSPSLKFMTENPGKQFTSSFQAIILDDNDKWYGDMIKLW